MRPFIRKTWRIKKLPEEYTTQKNFRTDPEIKRQFDAVCAEYNLSQSRIMTDMMQDVIDACTVLRSIQDTLETHEGQQQDRSRAYDDPAFSDIREYLDIIDETPMEQRSIKNCRIIQSRLTDYVEKTKKKTGGRLNPTLETQVEEVLVGINQKLKSTR